MWCGVHCNKSGLVELPVRKSHATFHITLVPNCGRSCRNGRRITRTFDRILLPLTRHAAEFDFRRVHMDADHVRNGAAPSCTPSAESPTLASLA